MDRKVALQLRNTEPLDMMAKAMADAGFKYVAMAFGDEKPMQSDDWEKHVYNAGDVFAKYGLKCIQTHAPYYDLMISAEERDENFETALCRSIEATRMLGAEICAVHPRSVIIDKRPVEYIVDRERSLEENIKSFKPLVELCEKNDVLLGIENLMTYPFVVMPDFYSCIAEDHCAMIDALDSDHVAAIWDFGHANLVDTDHAERIKTLGSRIKGTHVHNNGAKEDTHLPPFMPPRNVHYVRRTVDWNSVLAALRATGYDGYLTLETVVNLDHSVGPYVKYLYDSVCELESILKEEI